MKYFLVSLGIATVMVSLGTIPGMGLPGAFILFLCDLPFQLLAPTQVYQSAHSSYGGWEAAILLTWLWPLNLIVLGVIFGWMIPNCSTWIKVLTYIVVGYLWGGMSLPLYYTFQSSRPVSVEHISLSFPLSTTTDAQVLAMLESRKDASARSWNNLVQWNRGLSLLPIEFAAFRNSTEILEAVSAAGADPKLGFPLHAAAYAGWASGVTWFIEHGRSSDDLDTTGRIPLHYALGGKAYYEYLYGLNYMASFGSADPAEVFLYADNWPMNPDRGEAIQLLTDRRPSASDATYVEPLFFAAALGNRVNELRDFLAEGADPFWQDRKGRTALHVAIHLGAWEVAEQLANVPGLKDIADTQGKRPKDMFRAYMHANDYPHKVHVDRLQEKL